MLRLVLATALISLVLSCQNVRLIADNGDVVVGRSLEFSRLPKSYMNYLVTEPNGTNHVMPQLPNCDTAFSFSSDYQLGRFTVWYQDQWINTTMGGMNSEGLSASALYFPGYAVYKEPEEISGGKCKNAIPQTALITYVLAKYSDLRGLIRDLKGKDFPTVWSQGDIDMDELTLHFVFHDRTGRSIVLEHTEENGVQWYQNSVGVMTNSPPYPWHITNLKNYPYVQRGEWPGYSWEYHGKEHASTPQWTGTGFSGLPGDYTSPSRFIKAATLATNSGKTADAAEGVTKMFHLLNVADLPIGYIMGGEHGDVDDYTWWVSVYDLSNSCIYYRSYTDMSIKRACLEKVGEEAASIAMEAPFANSFRDVHDILQRALS